MNIQNLKRAYQEKRKEIKERINEFKITPQSKYKDEFLFCTLTPQSNALSCWQAVEQLNKLDNFTDDKIKSILKGKTRFHNNKTRYILQNKPLWNKIKSIINKENRTIHQIREELSSPKSEYKVRGYGLKEASHFLRNIGKSNNKIAILDRHILKNLKNLGIIKETNIKNKQDYLEKEQAFLKFAQKVNIPPDELDLLFWSNENGTIFK